MSNLRIPRRSLNSVTQDLAPLMTIEDDEVDEGIGRPSTSSPASCPPVRYADSSTVQLTDSAFALKEKPRVSPYFKWAFGFLLIVAGVVLNTATPIYTVRVYFCDD